MELDGSRGTVSAISSVNNHRVQTSTTGDTAATTGHYFRLYGSQPLYQSPRFGCHVRPILHHAHQVDLNIFVVITNLAIFKGFKHFLANFKRLKNSHTILPYGIGNHFL